MMRIQYQAIIEKLFVLIDDELEMDTAEGRDAFRAMSQALFDVYIEGKNEQKKIASRDQ